MKIGCSKVPEPSYLPLLWPAEWNTPGPLWFGHFDVGFEDNYHNWICLFWNDGRLLPYFMLPVFQWWKVGITRLYWKSFLIVQLITTWDHKYIMNIFTHTYGTNILILDHHLRKDQSHAYFSLYWSKTIIWESINASSPSGRWSACHRWGTRACKAGRPRGEPGC